jgi:hypothetical protein
MDIGDVVREIEVLPDDVPITLPVEEPAQSPASVPEPAR